MNVKRYTIASLAAFCFIFLYEWVFHGTLLKPIYDSTADLWRAKEDCIMWAMLAGQFIFPWVFTLIYAKGHEGQGIPEGLRFGALIGLLFVPSNLIFYAVMPLPFNLVAYWIAGGILEMMLLGAIVAVIYKQK